MQELVLRQVQILMQSEWDEILELLAVHKPYMEPLVEEVIKHGPAEIAFEVVDNAKSMALTSLLGRTRLKKNLNSIEYDSSFPEPLRQARNELRSGRQFLSMSFCSLTDIGEYLDENPRTVISSFYLSELGSYVFSCWKSDEGIHMSRTDLGVQLTNLLHQLRPWLVSFDKRESLERNPETVKLLNATLQEVGQIFQATLWNCGPIRHLIIVPHKELHCLPLHASPIKNKGSFVPVFKVIPEISYAPSTMFSVVLWDLQRFLRVPRKPGGPRIMVVIDPSTDFREERTIWKTLFGEFFSGVTVVNTKNDFLTKHEDYDVIHFACHGSSSLVDHRKSALHIGNETLPFAEVFSDLNLLLCRNVTLAACETGAATSTSYVGDEYSGLDCSFLLSGAAGTVSTLWSVSHDISVLFSGLYYFMVFSGESPARAFSRFQRAVSTGSLADLLKDMRDKARQDRNKNFAVFFDTMLTLCGAGINWFDQMAWRIMGMSRYPLIGAAESTEV